MEYLYLCSDDILFFPLLLMGNCNPFFHIYGSVWMSAQLSANCDIAATSCFSSLFILSVG